MAIDAGTHTIGSGHGRILLRTTREGMAAQAGHDLTIEICQWSGELTISDGLASLSVQAEADMTSLEIRDATGGLKPLSDKDRRDITSNAARSLAVSRHPRASFAAAAFEPDDHGGGILEGTLTLAGQPAPLRLAVTQDGPGYRATGQVIQTAHGITPYRGFLGALKVSDSVAVEVTIDAPAASNGAGAS